MAGLTGLKRKLESTEEEKKLDEFISGAEKRVKALESSNKRYVRCNFSLNEDIIKLIDELIVKGQNARVNRSSIVRAAIENLSKYSAEELKEILSK